MAVFDFKKEYKELYAPKSTPALVQVPVMSFLMVNGKGNPNTEVEYKQAVEALYTLAYGIKMSKMSGQQPEGYFDFVVPPLEGLWWLEGEPFNGTVLHRKEDFCWTMMLRQPEFVTSAVFEAAKATAKKKKPLVNTSKVYLESFEEGLCAQVMHIGPYDDEPTTIAMLDDFITRSGYLTVMSGRRQHHEIYLSDPNKTEAQKMKTVLRHPVVKI